MRARACRMRSQLRCEGAGHIRHAAVSGRAEPPLLAPVVHAYRVWFFFSPPSLFHDGKVPTLLARVSLVHFPSLPNCPPFLFRLSCYPLLHHPHKGVSCASAPKTLMSLSGTFFGPEESFRGVLEHLPVAFLQGGEVLPGNTSDERLVYVLPDGTKVTWYHGAKHRLNFQGPRYKAFSQAFGHAKSSAATAAAVVGADATTTNTPTTTTSTTAAATAVPVVGRAAGGMTAAVCPAAAADAGAAAATGAGVGVTPPQIAASAAAAPPCDAAFCGYCGKPRAHAEHIYCSKCGGKLR